MTLDSSLRDLPWVGQLINPRGVLRRGSSDVRRRRLNSQCGSHRGSFSRRQEVRPSWPPPPPESQVFWVISDAGSSHRNLECAYAALDDITDLACLGFKMLHAVC